MTGCTYAIERNPYAPSRRCEKEPIYGYVRLASSGNIVSELCEAHYVQVMERIRKDRREDQYEMEVA